MVLPSKEIRMCHKVYKHLQQGSFLDDESGQDDLGEVHTYPHLTQEVGNDGTMLAQGVH